jgi:hypothetical protein
MNLYIGEKGNSRQVTPSSGANFLYNLRRTDIAGSFAARARQKAAGQMNTFPI